MQTNQILPSPHAHELFREMRSCPDLDDVPDADLVEMLLSPEWETLVTVYGCSRQGRLRVMAAA